MRNILRTFAVLSLAATVLAGCASSQIRARKAERDKVAATSHLYCDFVNGEIFPDVEVQLNLEMAKKCEHDKPQSITQYRTSNENMGIVYCCSFLGAPADAGKKSDVKADTKSDVKTADTKKTAATTHAAQAPSGDALDN